MDPESSQSGPELKVAIIDSNGNVDKNVQDVIVKYEKGERRRMLRNVIVLSSTFTVLFTAYSGMSRLQSSINTQAGLGTWSQTTVYASIVLSSMFVPTFVIQKFSAKHTIFFSMFGYISYIAAQFYPSFWTLIPTAALVGIGGAPLWAAKCQYVTKVAVEYAGLVGENSSVAVTRFFGIFFFIFQSSGIWGNLISTFLLSAGNAANSTKNIAVCGNTFCPSDARGGVLAPISDTKRYTLAGTFVVIGLCAAALVAFFVDSLQRYGEPKPGRTIKSTKDTILATFHQMKNPAQVLIIPLTLWSGIEQGFVGSDYYQAYVSCAWGVENLGYVGMCYAVCDTLGSITFGRVVRCTGRIPVFVFGAVVDVAIILVLFNWKPDPESPVLFFVVAGAWGTADAVWQTQVNALYGIVFPDSAEAAFSNYRLWESLGFVIAFMNSNFFCIGAKLYILLGVLGLGMMGYLTIEYLERRKAKAKTNL